MLQDHKKLSFRTESRPIGSKIQYQPFSWVFWSHMVKNKVFKNLLNAQIKQNTRIKQNLMSKNMPEKNCSMFLLPKKNFSFIALIVFKCEKKALEHFFSRRYSSVYFMIIFCELSIWSQ